ncbi:MAG TPA: hypothetical protein VJ021_02380 [Thermoplasmata archaeon]|nr:hypothetical protein [Thermoplasmata archaeon]
MAKALTRKRVVAWVSLAHYDFPPITILEAGGIFLVATYFLGVQWWPASLLIAVPGGEFIWLWTRREAIRPEAVASAAQRLPAKSWRDWHIFEYSDLVRASLESALAPWANEILLAKSPTLRSLLSEDARTSATKVAARCLEAQLTNIVVNNSPSDAEKTLTAYANTATKQISNGPTPGGGLLTFVVGQIDLMDADLRAEATKSSHSWVHWVERHPSFIRFLLGLLGLAVLIVVALVFKMIVVPGG